MSGIFNTELHFALIYILNGCMSQSKRETKEDQMPSMDPPARRPSDDGEGESPADVESHRICHPIAGVAVATVTTILFAGLLLSLVQFVCLSVVWRAAPEVCRTPSSYPGKEQLQLCQKERHDLDPMLHTATRDSRCRWCPGGWLWWRRRCYLFPVGPQENRRWGASAGFSRGHNGSLAVIEDAAEMVGGGVGCRSQGLCRPAGRWERVRCRL
ncbi:uncharacterized protein LOC118289424 [Scophthalmus maximus]|uniref:uncharacterized protein LOC118289424 n=1 Tax=Scophthalmus maximus TaxID=52904 RepID=UPI0015E0B996|nr:uncharacterized protein LOC118289424 [Scophthalmus maximus]